MSLAQLFFMKETFREQVRRWRQACFRKRSALSTQHSAFGSSHPSRLTSLASRFTLEALEPRLLLSATPTEVVSPQETVLLEPSAVTVPAGSLPSLDVDLNGQADALSDGILIIRHLFGFTGTALADGVVDPAGQRTDPTAIQNYLTSIRSALDVDLNQNADALSDGIMIIRSLFGFTGTALTSGAIDPAGQRTDPAVIATFLNNMNPQRELVAPLMTAGLQQDTGISTTDAITFNPTISGTLTDINQIALFTAGFDGAPVGTFVDVLADLQGTGAFTLSTARMNQLAGGFLADGAHILHLRATDARGNIATIDQAFTLDTLAPLSPTFDLSLTSDTGTLGDQQTTAGIVTLKGVTDPTTPIQLVGPGTSTLSNGIGTFQLPDLTLAVGANAFTFRASDVAGNHSDVTRTITRLAATQQADVVLTWNQIMLDAIQRDATAPPIASRGMAMVSLAMYDAINAIEGTPGYYVSLPAQAGTNADAATASAAHRVLSYLYPGQQALFDSQVAASLASIPDGSAKANGITLGQNIANAIIAIRATDGWNDFVDYVPGNQPGDWQLTAPMFDVALLPQWADLTPFALTSPGQFRPAGPPALDSAAYAAALNEVKALGSATGSTRTADQTQIARFWADGSGTFTPPGHWNQIAEQIALQQGNSLSANARLFAELNVALADAGITAWNSKYQYEFWRPITAIQQADLDGNTNTIKDASWSSLLITPPFPEYISGHSTFSGAAAEILTSLFGANLAFTTSSLGLPNVQRTFTSFEQAAQEAGRSRIYGGIHFEFSNQDGLTAGKALADFVLNRFTVTTDTHGPKILLNQSSGAVTKTNLTLTGQVLDNLSGVAALQAKLDTGAFAPLSFDASGHFTLPTALALDGTADGAHTVTFQATDNQANSSTVLFTFTLDTKAPVIALTSPVVSQVLVAGDRLIGTVLGTGSVITQLRYHFGSETSVPVMFDPVAGSFNQALNLSELGAGSHLLTVEAQDAAGNTASAASTVTLAAPIPFVLNRVTPEIGGLDIGTTFRPQIFFSRPVEPASLTSNNFYATGPDGTKLSATIVPSQDGSFAWLFFKDPMPGGSLVTVHVDGASIRAESDGQFLDADQDGQPGGAFEYSFATVSLTPIPGTTLAGRVVDPGPDLTPMTFDDIRVGPDGILHTSDDVFLTPLAGVKVFIVGLEDQAVFTDADGRFSFSAVPVGNVKVAIDGRTATNAPSGFYFPEMVMDAQLRVGEANRLMGTMGSLEAQAANATREEVYLPRLRMAILQPVSDSQATTVGVSAVSAPDLTPDQRSQLTIEIQPGSLLGADGLPIAGAKVGLSTVSPELVRDMLPPGLLQHTFDITIQAPEAVAFAAPAVLTFPNVFNAAPGTQLNFLSFDHTTGRLVIEGTATVSADGLTVTTDPGTGITKPGWHGMTPPGSDGCGGEAPAGPIGGGGAGPASAESAGEIFPAATVVENRLPPVALSFITADVATTDFSTKTWGQDQSDQCEENAQGLSESPTVNVRITIEGPLAQFMKPVEGGLPLVNQSFNIRTSGGGQKLFGFEPKTYDEILGSGGFTNLNSDRLYGAKVTITETRPGASGTFTRDISTYYQYRWIDVVDANAAMARAGNTAVFHRTYADGFGNVARDKDIDHFVGPYDHLFTHQANLEFGLGPAFRIQGTTGWRWDPFAPGPQTLPTDVMVFDQGTQQLFKVGQLQVKGTATGPSKINLNLEGFGDELRRVIQNLQREPGPDGTLNTADDRIFYHQDGVIQYDTVVSDRFKTAFAQFLPGQSYTQQDLDLRLNIEADSFQNAVMQDFQLVMDSALLGGLSQGYEFSSFQPDPLLVFHETVTYGDIASQGVLGVTGFADFRVAGLEAILRSTTIPNEAKEWAVAEAMNANSAMPTLAESPKVSISKIIKSWTGASLSFGQAAAIIASHELGHALGLKDAYLNGIGDVLPLNDIMNTGHLTNDVGFTTNHTGLLLASLGLHAGQDSTGNVISFSTLANELPTFKRNFFNADPSRYGTIPATVGIDLPGLSVLQGGDLLFPDDRLTIVRTGVDGPQGLLSSAIVSLRNEGYAPLTLGAIGLQGGQDFTISGTNPSGATLAPGQSVDITLVFDPAVVGVSSNILRIASNDPVIPVFDIALEGTGILAAPALQVTSIDNNLGGMLAASGTVAKAGVFTLRNDGVQTLTITDIRLKDGSEAFTLTGLPVDLATNSIQLTTGQALTFGATFNPDHVGLHRGLIELLSNDPATPVKRLSVVGTGLDVEVAAEWGNDFVAIEPQDLPGSIVLRAKSSEQGRYGFFLGPKQLYHQVIFDPETGLVSHSYPTTSASGGSRNLSSTIVFEASSAPDSDFDGLPDDVEFAVGTGKEKTDTDSDGLSDFTEVQQGLDPLGGQRTTPGVVGAVSLNGTGEAVVVYPSGTDPARSLAYVATAWDGTVRPQFLNNTFRPQGFNGLTIVDVTTSAQPAVIGAISLGGTVSDVDVDPGLNLAAVTDGNRLHVVDVSDPSRPIRLRTVVLPDGAGEVSVRDGFAYVAGRTDLVSVDLVTGEIIQTLPMTLSRLTDVALEGAGLFVMDTAATLSTIELLGAGQMAARGSLVVPGTSGQLFVGNGIAYMTAASFGLGGFATADVRNLAAPALLSTSDVPINVSLSKVAFAANGSGLGLLAGTVREGFTTRNVIDVMNVVDPTNTFASLFRIPVIGVPEDVTVAGGFALVSSRDESTFLPFDQGFLSVVQYQSTDLNGVAPTISIVSTAVDLDPAVEGLQVLEGGFVVIGAEVLDDVQIRSVELLVNNQVVTADLSFPWDLIVRTPTVTAGGVTLLVRARATDTGGNVTLSNELRFNVVRDTVAPVLLATTPADGTKPFVVPAIDLQFNEGLDETLLNPAGAVLIARGADGQFGTPDDRSVPVSLVLRNFGRMLSAIPESVLTPETYRLTVNPAILADRSGNHFPQSITTTFTIRPASDIDPLSGAAAFPDAPAANPGQIIPFVIPGITLTTAVTFVVIDDAGTQTTRAVTPVRIDTATGTGFYVVPDDAVTGNVMIPGDPDGPFQLQVVPVLTTVDLIFFGATDGTFTLTGHGFIEGNNTQYLFGTIGVIDTSVSAGPDVENGNRGATVTVAFSDDLFGEVRVKTAGGISAPFTVGFTELQTIALSGTPADPSKASANPGQVITLRGVGLTTSTDVVARIMDDGGVIRPQLFNPSFVDPTGTMAQIATTTEFNGAFAVNVVGSSFSPVLQVVPVVSGLNGSNFSQLLVTGQGFVEAAGSLYQFPGLSLSDVGTAAGPDVSSNGASVFISDSVLGISTVGFGPFTVTTAGGTSAPLSSPVLYPGQGLLQDVAYDAENGHILVVDAANIVRLNPATGAAISTIPLPGASQSNIGLQVLTAAIPSLGGTPVPAGHLLITFTDANVNATRMLAVHPTTGEVTAGLAFPNIVFPRSGLFHPDRGTLFLGESDLYEIDPATGTVLRTITVPPELNFSIEGMAVDPVTGRLWLGSDSIILEVDPATGAAGRVVELQLQGIDNLTGLALDGSGDLFVSMFNGRVAKASLSYDLAQPTNVTVSGITTAAAAGVPAAPDLSSANIGQMIELTGTGFGAGTQVLFQTRSAEGTPGLIAVSPSVVSQDGTRLQVKVPSLAATGTVSVRTSGSRNLGFGGPNDAIYRNVTVDFTAGSAGAVIRFADEGLSGLTAESWGLDNVVITPVAQSGAVIFSDDFEAGAKSQWIDTTTDANLPGVFSRFSGRFNGEQRLTVDGLIAGETYRLSFDLYVIGSWTGIPSFGSPDFFDVFVDGQRRFHESFSNDVFSLQTYSPNTVEEVALQIVPLITGTIGRPGTSAQFWLLGSGFMEGASTITVNGFTILDRVLNDNGTGTGFFDAEVDDDDADNGAYGLVLPFVAEGPLSVSTAGGSHQIPMPVSLPASPVQFSGIVATALLGNPGNPAIASANTGQSITLRGFGFTSNTLVQFDTVDDRGVPGTLTRTGTVGGGGQQLTVEVPAMAATGTVRVVGSDQEFFLQIVPTLRAIGGALTSGNQIFLEGTGLTQGNLTVRLGGRVTGAADVQMSTDSTGATAALDQQLAVVTVPTGLAGNAVQVTTAGGFFTLAPASITGITAVAASGTPARNGVASANIGQTITLSGNGFLPTDQVVFTGRDAVGNLLLLTATPVVVAGDGTGLEVVVPAVAGSAATTGMVRLARETSGLLLQVVPILNAVTASTGGPYHGGILTLTGTGFDEGLTTIRVGDQAWPDPSVSRGRDVSTNNTLLTTGVPTGAAFGPVSVTTLGGTSVPFAIGVGSLTATALSGTPSNPGIASANPGQAVSISGSGLTLTTGILFQIMSDEGVVGERIVQPLSVNSQGTVATLIVPDEAVTGVVSVIGDAQSTQLPLQIVPIVTGIDLTAVNGAILNFSLSGRGFIDEEGTRYRLGQVDIVDQLGTTGPDAFSFNKTATFSTQFSEQLFGAVSVKTKGGASVPFTVGYTDLVSTAFKGTPADPTQPSANAGQAVTIRGTGLSQATDLIARLIDPRTGTIQFVTLNPSFVNAAGTEAVALLPTSLNGAFAFSVLGSGFSPLLQIVPTITQVAAGDFEPELVFQGNGFVEGNGTVYSFGGGTVTDTVGIDGLDVLPPLNGLSTATVLIPGGFGFGPVRITTSGGSSDPADGTILYPALSLSSRNDVAFNPVNGEVLVTNSGQIFRVNPATGGVIASFPVPGSVNNFGGALHITQAAISLLGGTAVPTGSLLVVSQDPSPDRIFALDPVTGAVLASVTTTLNTFPLGVVFHPGRQTIFLLDENQNRLFEVNPADGTLAGSLPTPDDVIFGGLALDPVTGHLWLGPLVNTNDIVEVDPATGTVLRTFDLSTQTDVVADGLAFHSDGDLLISQTFASGAIVKIDMDLSPAQPTNVTVTGISGAALDGTPANGTLPSANVGQILELTGTGFGPLTQVLFHTRDNNGVEGLTAVLPTAMNTEGTRLQVVVPGLATTGPVTVRTTGGRDLSNNTAGNEAIYRAVTVDFTAAGGAATIRFNDEGLEANAASESWGLDNVRVALAAAPASPFFNDTFEGGAKPQWHSRATNTQDRGLFTEYSGRFNNTNQTLDLTGLSAGETYRLTFDLYILGSWDGLSATNGPDFLDVVVDGQRLFHEAFSNQVGSGQTFSPSPVADMPLQIVPVIKSMTGQPGTSAFITLNGSGFMEGASTLTIGGASIVNQFMNDSGSGTGWFDGDVTGTTNGSYLMVLPLAVEGPIQITTAGGSHSLAGPAFAQSSPAVVSGLQATALLGTPANGLLPSANTGQSITFLGSGFTGTHYVQFEAVDEYGAAGVLTRLGSPFNNGTELRVEVPTLARTGKVRLLGLPAEFDLQIVPTLRSRGGTIGEGNQIILEGTGFTEGAVTLTIDGQAATGLDVRVLNGSGESTSTTLLDQALLLATVPAGVGPGVIQVVTAGGSVTLAPSATSIGAIASTAVSGVPARSGVASANTGQSITVTGTGFLVTDRVVFTTINSGGQLTTTAVTPVSVAGDGTSLSVVVPSAAASGMVKLEREAAGHFLQIVPTLADVAGTNGGSFHGASLTLTGSGFIEGDLRIAFGNHTVFDRSGFSGPDVGSNNATLSLVVPAGVPGGPMTVTTFGGTSAPFGLTFTGITAIATSGGPTDPGQASANPGQTITLTGTGFDSTTDIIFPVLNGSTGVLSERIVRPVSVTDGTQLTVTVPNDAITGTISIVGNQSAAQILLQIVPRVTSLTLLSGGAVRVVGQGLIEGNGTVYQWAGVTVTDYSGTVGPNVTDANNTTVDLPRTVHGPGPFTVRTAGGTSVPVEVNHFDLGLVVVQDVAFNAAAGELLVADQSEIYRIDPASGQTLGHYAIPSAPLGFDTIGLQILPAAIPSLGGTAVAAGSLLISNRISNPERIFAVNPITGLQIGSVAVQGSIQAVGAAYHPGRGTIFLLSTFETITEINPATGATVGSFTVPFTVERGGLAIDPVTGNLWAGSHTQTSVTEFTPTGTLVRTVSLASQGLKVNEQTGLAFHSDGSLLVSATVGSSGVFGIVYKFALPSAPSGATTEAQTAVASDSLVDMNSSQATASTADSQGGTLDSYSLAYVQKSWVQDYVAEGVSLAEEDEEEELLIALPG